MTSYIVFDILKPYVFGNFEKGAPYFISGGRASGPWSGSDHTIYITVALVCYVYTYC